MEIAYVVGTSRSQTHAILCTADPNSGVDMQNADDIETYREL